MPSSPQPGSPVPVRAELAVMGRARLRGTFPPPAPQPPPGAPRASAVIMLPRGPASSDRGFTSVSVSLRGRNSTGPVAPQSPQSRQARASTELASGRRWGN
ncbi:uncharacterized protein LOC144263113 [Eretmochelys imbricata]